MCRDKEDVKCPRCGYELVIPLKPQDSKVESVWDVWCPRCGHLWALKQPIRVEA
ncbi:MAG: hypothetical protein RMJ14_05275 [Nitrososphaerota archaeon]|nr:hypothetical protein [Aigarchaeota archaeon]MDW8077029.1 hypothetical protein [Nitrososphaerota archaeon]